MNTVFFVLSSGGVQEVARVPVTPAHGRRRGGTGGEELPQAWFGCTASHWVGKKATFLLVLNPNDLFVGFLFIHFRKIWSKNYVQNSSCLSHVHLVCYKALR